MGVKLSPPFHSNPSCDKIELWQTSPSSSQAHRTCYTWNGCWVDQGLCKHNFHTNNDQAAWQITPRHCLGNEVMSLSVTSDVTRNRRHTSRDTDELHSRVALLSLNPNQTITMANLIQTEFSILERCHHWWLLKTHSTEILVAEWYLKENLRTIITFCLDLSEPNEWIVKLVQRWRGRQEREIARLVTRLAPPWRSLCH